MSTENRSLEETWVALLDSEGRVCARYSPLHEVLAIKRRGQEKRYDLAALKRALVQALDKTDTSC